MRATDVLADGFSRVRDDVHALLSGDTRRAVGPEHGVTHEQLVFHIDDASNTIAWLLWHLTRVQDDHVADVARTEQAWTSQGWVERLGLPFDPRDTGYGHRAEEVAAVAEHRDPVALAQGGDGERLDQAGEVGRARCRRVLQLVTLGGGAPVLGRLEGVDGGEPEAAEDRGVADGPGWWHGTASWTTGVGMAPLPCSACVRLQKIAHKPAEHRMGPDAGICSPVLVEIASAALGDRWVPWEVCDGSLRWTAGATIGRPVGGGAGVAPAPASEPGPVRGCSCSVRRS